MKWNIAGIVHIIETTAQEECYIVNGSVTKHGLIIDYDEEWIVVELIDGMTHVIYDDEIHDYYVEGNMLSIKLI